MELGSVQPPVAFARQAVATFRGMKEWRDYWRVVCAPKIRARRDGMKEAGDKTNNTEIAAAIEEASGKNTTRQLFEAWMKEDEESGREPYISQFLAMCEKIGMVPEEVLEPPPPRRDKVPLGRVNEAAVSNIKTHTGRRAKKSRR